MCTENHAQAAENGEAVSKMCLLLRKECKSINAERSGRMKWENKYPFLKSL